MKTAAEHFNSLPQPYSSQALANALTQGADLDKKYKEPEQAIASSFSFQSTPEGYGYWMEACCRLADGEDLSAPSKKGRGLILWGLLGVIFFFLTVAILLMYLIIG
jgi:hypothetical protein